MLGKLRRLGYGWIVLQGLLAAVVPKRLVALSTRTWLYGFENADELEPKDWYLRTVRAAGVGMIAAGLTGLLLDGDDADEPTVEIDAPEASEAPVESDDA